MMRLPRAALALARVDRAAFYSHLHAQDSVFLLEEPRTWLVIGYEDVVRLLRSEHLHSGREAIEFRLREWTDPRVASEFYRQWLMYMDGAPHAEWRILFMRSVSAQPRDNVPQIVPDLAALSARLHSAAPVCFTTGYIRPFVITELAAVAGVEPATIASGYTMLEATLSFLHGRGTAANPQSVSQGLLDWLTFLASVRENARGHEETLVGRMLAENDSLQTCGVALLPFIDVIDALVSLCGRIVLDAVRNQSRESDLSMQEQVREAVRLHPPFLVCNRTVNEPLTGATNLDWATGDRVTLMIGAANRDPRVFPEPDVAMKSRRRAALSFGLGAHACPGGAWTLSILDRFRESLDPVLKEWGEGLRVDEVTYFDEPAFAGVETVTLRLDDSQGSVAS